MTSSHTASGVEHGDLRADVIGNHVSILDKSTREQVLLTFGEARALRDWLIEMLTDEQNNLGETK